jgi:hypothetical protein
LGTKYLVVLCAGSALQLAKQSLDEAPYINCPKLSLSQSASPSVVIVCLRENLGFLTEGKLGAIFIKTFSWGLPTGRSFTSLTTRQQVFWHHHHRAPHQVFLAPLPGNEEEEAPTSTKRQQNPSILHPDVPLCAPCMEEEGWSMSSLHACFDG